MKKVVIFALGLALIGCGGGGDSGTAPTPEQPSEAFILDQTKLDSGKLS
ncbi:hypothetical protein JCM19236_441 [Vibrio sp. JCM 19236]|nr:hypothetical protein JCM19236_441 [Vibrio sp. JCM 19236]